MESDDDGCFGEELLADNDSDVEPQYIKTWEFETALSSLTDEERHLVDYLYLQDEQGTVRAYEKLTGISKSTVSRQQNAILEKLKKLLIG
jgi:DNA-directed RNA polymerase specialized sigma subunit